MFPGYLFLHHAVDQEGLAFWASLLQKGLRDEYFLAFLVASSDYFAALGH